jgi:hypothetical protein
VLAALVASLRGELAEGAALARVTAGLERGADHYYDQIVDQTLKANPPGVADEFPVWVRSL